MDTMKHLFPIKKVREIVFPQPPVIADRGFEVDGSNVRMNLNESPFPPSPKAIHAAVATLGSFNSYPDHGCSSLAAAVSRQTGIPTNRISFGNGSGELLVALAMLSIEPGDEAVVPTPTFPTCPKGVQIAAGKLVSVPLRSDGVNDVPAMLGAITAKTRLFYLCTPNNPTGGTLGQADILRAIEEVPENCLLVIDEAYHEFSAHGGGPDVLALLSSRVGPWAVTRSFSKAYCLAGLRVGYAISSGTEIQLGLMQLRPNFNVNRVALAAATEAYADKAHLEATLDKTIGERNRLGDGLLALGFEVFPSQANFLAAGLPTATQVSAQDIVEKLKQGGILIQAMPWPNQRGSLRITVSSRENNDRFLSELREILA